MFCDEALDAVEAVAAGDRTPDGRLAAHYASCPNCATALSSARELERLLRQRPTPVPPPQFTARTLSRIRRARWRSEQWLDAGFNLAFAVIVLSIVVDFLRSRVLYRTAEETSSHALEADALHFDSDMWSSLAVLVGLFGIALGYTAADSVAALAVSLLICIAGWRLGRRTIDTLTDTAPPGAAIGGGSG